MKVGDRVSEKGRIGTIVAFHTKGTVDVHFDDMEHEIRRPLHQVQKLRSNPMQLRRNVANPIGVTHHEMQEILNKPIGEYEMDGYIRWKNFPRGKAIPKGFIKPQLMPALYLRANHSTTKSGETRFKPRPLYGSSAKTTKSDGSAVEIRVVYLQPKRQSDVPMPKSGQKDYPKDFADMAECAGMYPPLAVPTRNNPDTCPFAGECSKFCLVGSGRLGKEDSQFSAWCKTWLWAHYPLIYLRQILKETVKEAERSARYGLEFYARLNGTSDITWEKYIDIDRLVEDTPNFGGFYDYTKWGWKARQKGGKWIDGKQPEHYDITFSISEKEDVTGKDSLGDAYDWLANGGRVAVVVDQWLRYPYDQTPSGKKKGERGRHKVKGYFDGKLQFRDHAIYDYATLQAGATNAPDYAEDWQSEIKKGDFPLIIDGDETDFRFNDPPYSIVILKPKGIAVRDDGQYYTMQSVYRTTLDDRRLTKKGKAFIKSKDYVLDLQDQILDYLGEQKLVAKNPSQVTVQREKGFYYVVYKNRSMTVNGRSRFGTLKDLKQNLALEGYQVVGKGNKKYVVPR